MKKFKNLKNVVQSLLEKDRTLADNEKALNWKVWEHVYGKTIAYMSFEAYKTLPSEGTIQRLRRLVESENPHLRGSNYNNRTSIMEHKVKQELKEL